MTENIEAIWHAAVEKLKPEISDQAFEIWISPIKPLRFEENRIVLQTENLLQKQIVSAQFGDKIKIALSKVMGFDQDYEIISEEEQKTVKEKIKDKETPFKPTDSSFFTFDNFMVGESNKYAYSICKAVAENPGTAYNPLFLHGSTGLGKTHLLKAIKNHIEKENPDFTCIYISSETFTNELIESIQTKKTQDFKKRYRSADVLLIDDVQFFAGKDSTQEEFFHTYNSLMEGGKQIILASDRAPKDIHPLEDRLAGRFSSGIITSIQTPELELRVAIIKSKAALYNIKISDDVALFIAETIKNSIRNIESVMNKVRADQMINGTTPSVTSVKTNLKDIIEDNEPVPVLIDRVIVEVGRITDVKPEDIKSKKRQMNIKNARHLAIYIIRELLPVSLDEIGSYFSSLDHASVHHAIRRTEEKMQQDNTYRLFVEDLIRNVKEP